jgi:hypothetical protein
LRSLRRADLTGVFLAADEVLPEAVAFADDVTRGVGILEFISEDGVEAAAAEEFVVLVFGVISLLAVFYVAERLLTTNQS